MHSGQEAQRVAEVAAENRSEMISECIVELDLSPRLLNKAAVPADVVEWMIRALEATKPEGNKCGFYVFDWFMSNFSRLTRDSQIAFTEYTSENYGYFSDPPLLISMAEWIGSRGDWSVSVVQKWLDRPIHPDALHFLRLAIEQLETAMQEAGDGRGAALAKLKQEYEAKLASQ